MIGGWSWGGFFFCGLGGGEVGVEIWRGCICLGIRGGYDGRR